MNLRPSSLPTERSQPERQNRRTIRHGALALAAGFSLALTLTACERSVTEARAVRTALPAAIAADTARIDSIVTRHTVSGTLEAPLTVEIFNQVEGRILELPAHEGDNVASGDILARLDDSVIRAELVKVIAQRRQSELDLSRQEKLLQRNAASQDEVAQARTALELARAEESLQRTLLDRSVISAPISGLVSHREREQGDVVSPHTHLLTLLDPSSLVVAADVSELQLARLHRGDRVGITVDALPDHRFEGQILRIHPTIDRGTRKGLVEVELKPPPKGAMPGQLARVTFTFEEGERLTVPLAAVSHDRTGPYVYRIEDDIARRIPITLGSQFGDRIEIRSGLSAGDTVVISGFVEVRDGKAVETIAPTASAPAQAP